jgi:predicted nucleic acid-binding protein
VEFVKMGSGAPEGYGNDEAQRLEERSLEFVPVGEEIGFLSGELAPLHTGVPLRDAVVAATARTVSAAMVTDDPRYERLWVKTQRFKWRAPRRVWIH